MELDRDDEPDAPQWQRILLMSLIGLSLIVSAAGLLTFFWLFIWSLVK